MKRLDPKAFYLFWWGSFWGFLFLFIFLGFFAAVFFVGDLFTLGFAGFVLAYAMIVLIVALALSAIWSRLLYNSYSFDLTAKTINIRWGVIWKHSSSIPYERVQNIDILRGVAARLLGLSTVWIQTAGASAVMGGYGAMRPSEGLLPGLLEKDAENLRTSILKKIKGRKGL